MLNNKTILVTGGTGSFGNCFVKRVLTNYNPKKVIIYSRDEFKQFNMLQELKSCFKKEELDKVRFFIGDVRDKERLYRAFKDVDYVIHAAAMKQVPACEYNPFEAIKTNIHGAQNIVDAALDIGVKKVVALSTDKAVNPVNLYGGTKLVSDKLFISANAYSGEEGTVFSVVRYGNVAGSRGSVIPYFKKLVEEGVRDLPITDFEMTRFWITLDEGVDLVIKALGESEGGETYISKIPSFRITDLAQSMLEGVKLNHVGIREGEKLHEVMVSEDDSRFTYEYDKHYIVYPHFDWFESRREKNITGCSVEKGFEYNSGTNSEWLSIENLREEIGKMGLLPELSSNNCEVALTKEK